MELRATPMKSVFNYGHHHGFIVLLESFSTKTHLCLHLSKRRCEIFFSGIFVVQLIWFEKEPQFTAYVLFCALFHKFNICSSRSKKEETERIDSRLHRRDDWLCVPHNISIFFKPLKHSILFIIISPLFQPRTHSHMF